MFAGIVRGKGRVLRQVERGGDRTLSIGFAGLELDPAPGDSIAVNGVCLTATACGEDAFDADVSAETLAVTTLGGLAVGAAVNLEPSLRLGDSLDGHLVYGHVDGVGRVASVSDDARSLRLAIDAPAALARYLAPKGSVAVDGTSLTINAVAGARLEVNIIPHTRDATIISGYTPGTPVNIEVDMIARYLERLFEGPGRTIAGTGIVDTAITGTGITRELLERHGFIDHK